MDTRSIVHAIVTGIPLAVCLCTAPMVEAADAAGQVAKGPAVTESRHLAVKPKPKDVEETPAAPQANKQEATARFLMFLQVLRSRTP